MTPKDCVITTRDGGRKLYWNGKSFTSLWNAAALYTLAGAKRKGGELANAYGLSMTVEEADSRMVKGRAKNPASAVVSVYGTQSGKEGLRITKHYAANGRVFYSYMGTWGAGSVDPVEMARVVKRLRETKRGMHLISGVEFGREENPVPASSKAGQRGTAKTSVQKAADLYKRFTGNTPHKKAKIVHEKDQAFLQVGTVDGILYTTNRDGRMEQYIHHFRPKSRPSLAVTADGKVARTVGGNFTFTERGFVDEDRDGNPVE